MGREGGYHYVATIAERWNRRKAGTKKRTDRRETEMTRRMYVCTVKKDEIYGCWQGN